MVRAPEGHRPANGSRADKGRGGGFHVLAASREPVSSGRLRAVRGDDRDTPPAARRPTHVHAAGGPRDAVGGGAQACCRPADDSPLHRLGPLVGVETRRQGARSSFPACAASRRCSSRDHKTRSTAFASTPGRTIRDLRGGAVAVPVTGRAVRRQLRGWRRGTVGDEHAGGLSSSRSLLAFGWSTTGERPPATCRAEP